MHAMLNIAVRAARAAGRVAMKTFSQPHEMEIEMKSANDYVTNADKAAELAIIQTIQRSYPDHQFLAEESGELKGTDADYLWVIDPIDGTSNFMRGVPHFCISIALLHKGAVQHAVVYDPVREEMFTATRGGGAQLNGYRIRTANAKDLNGTLLATGLPFRAKNLYNDFRKIMDKFFEQASDIRRQGSAALDLAYVAAGRYDGYWESGLKPWDTMAGDLLVREAGGVVTDFTGGDKHNENGNIVAANPKVVQAMLTQMRPLLTTALK